MGGDVFEEISKRGLGGGEEGKVGQQVTGDGLG